MANISSNPKVAWCEGAIVVGSVIVIFAWDKIRKLNDKVKALEADIAVYRYIATNSKETPKNICSKEEGDA